MIGFDGDPLLLATVRTALRALLEVFPEHLPKARRSEWTEGAEAVRNEQFDAILRTYRKDRLGIPIQALRATGDTVHGFELMHLRRLAWFVPSLLASWLDRAPGPGAEPFGASDLEEMLGAALDEEAFTDDEDAALAAFFETVLDAALATPLHEPHEPAVPRPLEDGVRVWSLCSPSVPLDVLRVARAFRVPLDPLVARWSLDPAPRALDHLLEAAFDTALPAKHFLSDEAVADRLGEAFFGATGERALRLSKAEAMVRRNIVRRTDI